ncbi:MAG: AIR synthase family protein [Anaerolineales bacterium]|nr:AIR synthase family protein [Anaerolineales bacterium]
MKSSPEAGQTDPDHTLLLGKLPLELMQTILSQISTNDTVLQGPGVGLDCAVINLQDLLLVVKSDPITFTAADIGWYAVHVNANDIATTGAQPSWFLATLLLPEGLTNDTLVRSIFGQIESACSSIGAVLVGGHTEVTAGLGRPIISGTMIGTTTKEQLKSPARVQPGDRLLLTKSIAIEAASILAQEFRDRLIQSVPAEILKQASSFLYEPGLSVLPEARIASRFSGVHAMHDPTEGGLSGALWELSAAANVKLIIDKEQVPISREAELLCRAMQINPWEAIASGALLIAAAPQDAVVVQEQIRENGIRVSDIGYAEDGQGVFLEGKPIKPLLPQPERDAIALLFEKDKP